MPTKDELETKLYEKMSQENEVFLAEMKTKSPDEIISHAYEIACRDNLLMLFEDETSLSERQLTVLNEFEHPLSQLIQTGSPAIRMRWMPFVTALRAVRMIFCGKESKKNIEIPRSPYTLTPVLKPWFAERSLSGWPAGIGR